MSLSDTKIHHTELLLTLDYLLRYTDDSHPATQQDICRHATHFGLKYDPKNQKGNDVKRQRIGECLKFLMDIADKYPDEVPFVLQRTDSGKYYIEQKHYLSEEQILKVLAAVENDKYTQDEDTSFLIDRLLDSLSSIHQRGAYLKELEKLNKGVKKYNFETNRKIRLVNKAFNEGKLLKLQDVVYHADGRGVWRIFYTWYRVYAIKEFRNKPYAVLIPVSESELIVLNGYLFQEIEGLDIPKGPDKDVICKDFEEHRDLDELYRKMSRRARHRYTSPKSLLSNNIMPMSSGCSMKVGFYVREVFYEFVKRSFEQFFSTTFNCVGCTSFDTVKEDEAKKGSKDYIIPHPLEPGEKPKYYIVNMNINRTAFMGWLSSDVHGNGAKDIAGMVEIVGPSLFNKFLYRKYLVSAKRIARKLTKEDVEKTNEEAKRML